MVTIFIFFGIDIKDRIMNALYVMHQNVWNKVNMCENKSS